MSMKKASRLRPTVRTPQAGFVMVRKGRLNVPLIICERCGQEITDIESAGVVYRPSLNQGDASPITVLCKTNGCLSAPEYRDVSFSWEDLKPFLFWLLSNLGVRDAKELVSAWQLVKEYDKWAQL